MHPNAIILSGGIALAALPLRAAEIVKADNGFAYNLEDSWVDETVPGTNDIAVFDSILTTGPKPAIGSSLNWGGIRADASLGVGVTFGNTAGSVLTIGSGGIVHQSTGAGALVIASNFAVSANQTWNAAAGTAKDAISFTIPATMDLGGFTVTRTGAGRMNITVGAGATSISNGSLLLQDGTTEYRSSSGASTVPASFSVRVDHGATWITSRGSSLANSFNWNGNIQLNGGSWQVSGATNPVNIGGTITAQADSTLLYSQGTGTTAVDHTISAPITGSGALAIRNTSANPNHRITLTGDNSGYTGSIALDGASGSRTLRLASANSGSAAATWTVGAGNTLELHGITAGIGNLEGTGTIRSTGTTGTTSAVTVSRGSFGGAFSDGGGALGVTKTGSGMLRLDGASTHSGMTDVQGGILSGTGSLAGSLRIRDGAVIAPGNSTGTFSLGGSFTQDFGSVYLAEIANPSSMDLVSLFGASGELAFNGTLQVALIGGFAPAFGDTFDFFDWTAGYTVSGSPDFDLPDLSGGLSWNTSNFLADGSISVVPEPSSLLLAGMSSLLLVRRQPHRRASAPRR
jgi:autotransporter-associated beta strand protein